MQSEETKTASFCTNAIADILKEYGKRWLIPINFILFLPGLLLLITCDLVQVHTQSNLLSLTCAVISCIFLFLKFDVWKVKDHKNILKLMYILNMAFNDGTATVTYLFLVIYENIVAYNAWKGNENVESTL